MKYIYFFVKTSQKITQYNNIHTYNYIYSVFFMQSKIFVHLTYLKLPEINQTYLKIFVLGQKILSNYTQTITEKVLKHFHYISQFKYKCVKQKITSSMFTCPQLKLYNSFFDERLHNFKIVLKSNLEVINKKKIYKRHENVINVFEIKWITI